MSDPFLEREKELMKLNESLNSKMSFDLKTPKASSAKSSNSNIKFKKSLTNKPVKSDANHAKNGIKEANKLKNDSCDVKNPFANTYSTEKLCEKYELDPKDAAFNRNNNTINDDNTNKICNEFKRTTNDEDNDTSNHGDNNPINGHDTTMCDTLIETIEKTIDTKPSTNATQLSLIPGNVFRKNASAEGIIK